MSSNNKHNNNNSHKTNNKFLLNNYDSNNAHNNGNSAGFMEDDGTRQLLATLGLVPQSSTGMFGQLQTPFDTLGGADADLAMWNFLSLDGQNATAGNPNTGALVSNANEQQQQNIPQQQNMQQQQQQAHMQQMQPHQSQASSFMPGFEGMW
jgi:hypothetical protein